MKAKAITVQGLHEMLAHHEHAAASVRTTLALFGLSPNGNSATNGAGAANDPTLVATGAKRGRPRKHLRKKKRAVVAIPEPVFTSEVSKRREKTLQFLAQFNTDNPFRPTPTRHGNPLGPLVHRGYLKKKGEGYIRTGKEYRV